MNIDQISGLIEKTYLSSLRLPPEDFAVDNILREHSCRMSYETPLCWNWTLVINDSNLSKFMNLKIIVTVKLRNDLPLLQPLLLLEKMQHRAGHEQRQVMKDGSRW